MVQASGRIPVKAFAAALLVALAGPFLLWPGQAALVDNHLLRRTPAEVVSAHATRNGGPVPMTVRTAEGTLPAYSRAARRSASGSTEYPVPAPGTRLDVLVDARGLITARSAGASDGTEQGRARALPWLAGGAAYLLLLEAFAISSLVRRRSIASVLTSQSPQPGA
ncbi:hypothetical protein ACQP1U_11645 [Actinomycetota bacterium]